MIKQKLIVLEESGIIDTEVHNYVLAVCDYLKEKQIIKEDHEADVFLTHLAMAAARQKSGEAVNALDPFIKEQIISDSQYLHSQVLWQELAELVTIDFDETELDYFYLHICNMLNEG
ncbi:PRD domain-containing protein [Enterococcus sp. BWM-S5]|uniref:PRD domain-containing protein n=1 Tax=Enterococcus larvae TaxID=2794352 RepID=A0ABS4CFN0_9ENTE|nr:PRD domain-containing protein [Enterococcus larvae]MBP1045072.1 PRD domain-containing protein [Enterococcus larvae]